MVQVNTLSVFGEIVMMRLALALCLCVMAAEANAGANCAHSQSWQCDIGDLVGAPAPVLGSGVPVVLAIGGVLLATRFLARRRRP